MIFTDRGHSVADVPFGQVTRQGDAADVADDAGFHDRQRVKFSCRRCDGQLNGACASRHIARPSDVQFQICPHSLKKRGEHVLQVVGRRRVILKDPTDDLCSSPAIRHARQRQDADREHRGRTRCPNVPVVCPASNP